MIDRGDIIKQQLELSEARDVEFDDGRKTSLVPVQYLPQIQGGEWRVALDGGWKVRKWPFGNEKRMAGIRCADESWDTVEQPGKVFYYDPEENPQKVRNWDRVTLAHIHPDDGAMLRRSIMIPRAWKGKRVYLTFDGIYPAGRVYLNGKLLGAHMSGLTPVEWDVTDVIHPGRKALVAVRLLRKHKFCQLDMVRHACEFCGLAQNAYFHATESVQISGYHLVPELDRKCRRGSLQGTVTVRNHNAKKQRVSMEVVLRDQTGSVKGRVRKNLSIAPGMSINLPVRIDVPDPLLWNDEYPNLYRAAITLRVVGQETQVVSWQAGFRRFEVAGERATLNGKPVKFRGVNHLTFHPEFGMYTPREWLRRSLALMKKANVNAIRTHFLGNRALADVCDELGIYLLQELPVDWGTHYIHDPEWVGPALMRIHGGVLRDRHHPSVMIWSVGNENMPWDKDVADDGWNHLRIFDDLVKTLDPTRPTMFPPPGPANKIKGILEVRVGDIADIHYSFKLIDIMHKSGKITNPRAWDGTMETMTREQAMARGWSGVWFSSEYGIFNYQPDLLNAPYLSVIADTPEDLLSGRSTLQAFSDRLAVEWGRMRDDPTCLGGAYFPWICSGGGNNPWGWVRWGEDADWGVVCADLTPKPAFWAMRAIFAPVQFPGRLAWKPGQKYLEFKVTNLFNAIDLKDCTLRTMQGRGGKWMGQMRAWRDVRVRCAPGKTAKVRIPLWNNDTVKALADGLPVVCRCILLDPKKDRVIASDIVVVPPKINNRHPAMPIGPDAEI